MLKIMSTKVKEQRAQRLLKVLKNVHDETKDDFVQIYISKKYNVSQQTELKIRSEFLQHKRDGKKHLYKWKSIKPNIHMARKLYDFLYKQGQSKNKNQIYQKPIEVKQETLKKEISLFWGLIKIKY